MDAAPRSTFLIMRRGRRDRHRLYPRAHYILQRLSEPNAMLIWCRAEGRYRLNNLPGRPNVAIGRTVRSLLRLGAVKPLSRTELNLRITKTGHRLLRKHEFLAETYRSARRACNGHNRSDAGMQDTPEAGQS